MVHCPHCGTKNPAHQARFCMMCGRLITQPGAGLRWMDVLGVTLLVSIGLVGIYMHPLLEVGIVAYIAIAASAVWVATDAPKFGKDRWPWTMGTVGLWFFVFPVYLTKTRGAKGLVPGILLVGLVLGMQLFPEVYSSTKHYKRGLIYAGQQRLTKAEEEFRAAVKQDDRLGEGHLNLGIVYMSQGLLDAAEKELLKAKDLLEKFGVKMGPGNKNEALSLCLANLSAVYAMHTSEAVQILNRGDAKRYYAEAQKYADEAMKLDPDNVRSAELVRRLEKLRDLIE